jgi:hypothetical protein
MQGKYRQFGLMGEFKKIFTLVEHGAEQINERKEQLYKARKLVLVLDLDNTLLHSTEFRMSSEHFKQKNFRRSGI